MHDPFAMRPFFGYNAGQYMAHWLNIGNTPNAKLPRIYHVNWFRKDTAGKFIWPGFGENSRVLDWICRRIDGEDCARETPIGYVPKENTLNLTGLKESVDLDELFRLPTDFWQNEVNEIRDYFDKQLPQDLPEEIGSELNALKERVSKMS